MKKLQNNFTTIEQAKRLLELGVPQDTADMYYIYRDIIPYVLLQNDTFTEFCGNPQQDMKVDHDKYTPCWSVGRLMEIYDICFPKNGDWPNTRKWEDYLDVDEYNILIYTIDCIETAVEKGYIDFSKLEE